MPGKRSRLFAVVIVAVMAAVTVALLRRGNAVFGASAQRPSAPACSFATRDVRPPQAISPDTSAFTLALDFAGAETLISALERDSLSDANIDSLLRVPGLCAMVDNVTRYYPGFGEPEFRKEIRQFARKKKGGKYDGYFRLGNVWNRRQRIRALTTAIRAEERRVVAETRFALELYRPDTGRLGITAYFVAGGVSDGFIFESDPTSFYANLVNAEDDVNGIVSNLAHESYHAMQVVAQERAGINPRWDANDKRPLVERLFMTTLSEGTANYVVDPTRSTATGPNMDSSRQRYRRHAQPKRIAENFARFDDVLKRLREGRVTWENAYQEGFSSVNDASFYFVGYEMTKAIERHCGRDCIGRLFQQQPVEFFRRYIALYQTHPDISGRFSRETEAFIASYPPRP